MDDLDFLYFLGTKLLVKMFMKLDVTNLFQNKSNASINRYCHPQYPGVKPSTRYYKRKQKNLRKNLNKKNLPQTLSNQFFQSLRKMFVNK